MTQSEEKQNNKPIRHIQNHVIYWVHDTELRKTIVKERDKKRLVRENIEFRANERENDCSARKYTRLDPDIKVKERDKMRLVRENIEFRAEKKNFHHV